jgi:hypothetical protein
MAFKIVVLIEASHRNMQEGNTRVLKHAINKAIPLCAFLVVVAPSV